MTDHDLLTFLSRSVNPALAIIFCMGVGRRFRVEGRKAWVFVAASGVAMVATVLLARSDRWWEPLGRLVFFPSGHMAFFATLASSLILMDRRWTWALVVSGCLYGWYVVFLGFHTWPEVLGAVMIAVPLTLLSHRMLNWIAPRIVGQRKVVKNLALPDPQSGGRRRSLHQRGTNLASILSQLAGYLRPYAGVYLLGILGGIGLGAVTGFIPLAIQFVGRTIFESGSGDHWKFGSLAWVNDLGVRFLHEEALPKGALVALACLVLPAIMLLRGLLDFLNNYCSEWTSQKVLADIRYDLMQRIAAQSLDFFNDSRSGALIQRVANETRAMQGLLTTLSTQMITQPTTLISGLVVLFKLDWRFTAVALVAIPCALVPLLFFWKEIRRMSGREEAARGDLVTHLHEFFGGIKVIKAFSRTRHELERFDARSRAEFRQTMKTRCMVESTAPIVECLAAVGIAVGLYHVYSVGMSGITFVSLCAGIFLLYQPLKTMARTNLFLAQGYQVAESVVAMMRLQPSVTDAPGAIELTACDGAIECADVTFSYRPGIPALADFSFRFESGKFYALVGESGAGKSTLFSLILRFYDVDQGSIRLGGKDLRSVTQDSLRGQIGIVTQDTFLFHESIYQNILYGRLDATRDEVLRAAELAHAHAFIMAQQNGYDTIVGDKGCKLSGGQQQRVAIARALLKNAPVLLLDEATSSLDSVSERHIQAAIGNLASGRTVIAIAHRLSTILQADQILVLDRGRLLEVGTHRELLQHSGIYRRLYDVQFG